MRAAVVLAAGLSRRMGTDKLMLPVDGLPMYRHVLRLALTLHVDLRIVVTNNGQIAQEAETMGFTVVPSPRAAEGMGFSVAAGAAALGAVQTAVFLNADQPFLRVEMVENLLEIGEPRAAEGMGFSVAAGAAALGAVQTAVFLNADQPFLRVEMVENLLEIGEESGKIVVPVVEGMPCSPCVFPHRFFQELSMLSGTQGGKAVWKQHAEDTLLVPCAAAGFDDVDTREQYGRLDSISGI